MKVSLARPRTMTLCVKQAHPRSRIGCNPPRTLLLKDRLGPAVSPPLMPTVRHTWDKSSSSPKGMSLSLCNEHLAPISSHTIKGLVLSAQHPIYPYTSPTWSDLIKGGSGNPWEDQTCLCLTETIEHLKQDNVKRHLGFGLSAFLRSKSSPDCKYSVLNCICMNA